MYEAGGVGGDVPTDMPRPLRVGQSVVARHPGTRTAADGIVLTIKPSKYRVQFNRWGLTGAWLWLQQAAGALLSWKQQGAAVVVVQEGSACATECKARLQASCTRHCRTLESGDS